MPVTPAKHWNSRSRQSVWGEEDGWGGEDKKNDSKDKFLRANEHTQKIKFELHSYMYIIKLNSQKNQQNWCVFQSRQKLISTHPG